MFFFAMFVCLLFVRSYFLSLVFLHNHHHKQTKTHTHNTHIVTQANQTKHQHIVCFFLRKHNSNQTTTVVELTTETTQTHQFIHTQQKNVESTSNIKPFVLFQKTKFQMFFFCFSHLKISSQKV
eukprot:c10892_g1_i1.p1 GENE.c10892_g1_i1~~c10892_g1_i1.p1  ORF type:complete len:124 (-),score=31.16 c10892_g1_i1:224-595(-)